MRFNIKQFCHIDSTRSLLSPKRFLHGSGHVTFVTLSNASIIPFLTNVILLEPCIAACVSGDRSQLLCCAGQSVQPKSAKGDFAMRKLNSFSLKVLKMLHILMIVLFLGGILSSFALLMRLDLSNFEDVYSSYRIFNIISDNVVKIGAQGTILLGLVYGFFTKWGFVKHKWLVVKWFLFIAQTIIGIFVVDKLMMANIALLETTKALALTDPTFIRNHFLRLDVVMLQIGLTLCALILSILKPGKSKVLPQAQPVSQMLPANQG